MSYENYKNCVEEIKDKNGKVIKYHDVVRTSRGEILLVGFGVNHHHKIKGLNAFNNFIGAHDWLDVYQDGQYTGDVHVAEITYITDYAQQDGYVVLGIK